MKIDDCGMLDQLTLSKCEAVRTFGVGTRRGTERLSHLSQAGSPSGASLTSFRLLRTMLANARKPQWRFFSVARRQRKLVVLGMSVLLTGLCTTNKLDATTIDFDSLPDGSPTVLQMIIGNQFESVGVRFRSDGDDSESPTIGETFITSSNVLRDFSRPPDGEFNIVAEFLKPVVTVSADVFAADDVSVIMTGKNEMGTVIGSVTSVAGPLGPKGTLSFSGVGPIKSVEWVTTDLNAAPLIDNLTFAVPEPQSCLLFATGLAFLISLGRRRR